MYTSKTSTCYLAVCNVLDELADSANRIIHWRRPVYAAIDELRAMAAPAEQIEVAEKISIALLKLDWAIQKHDAAKEEHAREQLAGLGEAWQAMADTLPATEEYMIDEQEVGSGTAALERIAQRY